MNHFVKKKRLSIFKNAKIPRIIWKNEIKILYLSLTQRLCKDNDITDGSGNCIIKFIITMDRHGYDKNSNPVGYTSEFFTNLYP